MSGFEDTHVDDVWAPRDNQTFPDDFSLDEAEFASELRDLFGPEREELPPLYVQTLLQNAHISAGPGFEQKTAYRVFRRLSLARSPLVSRKDLLSTWRAVRGAPRHIALSVSLLIVFMVFTMVLASPAFGAGVRILLGQTGVEQVHGYPAHVHPSPQSHTSGKSKTPLSTTMPIFWLGATAGGYTYLGTRLLDPPDWSRGPIVDLQYTLTQSSGGTGVLDIREFQVSSQYAAVLQVVQDGSVTRVQVGNTPAVYVDGVWAPVPVRERGTVSGTMGPPAATPYYTWETGIRSELIFERNGVVFWIVGDQRDGAGVNALVSLAGNLVATSYSQLDSQWSERLRIVDEALIQSFQGPPGGEVYHLVRAGDSVESGSGVFVSSEP
jgi:hypothetical protein